MIYFVLLCSERILDEKEESKIILAVKTKSKFLEKLHHVVLFPAVILNFEIVIYTVIVLRLHQYQKEKDLFSCEDRQRHFDKKEKEIIIDFLNFSYLVNFRVTFDFKY